MTSKIQFVEYLDERYYRQFFLIPISQKVESADFVTSDLNKDKIILMSIREKVVKKILNNISPNFN